MGIALNNADRTGQTDSTAAVRLSLQREPDVIVACQKGRSLAGELGFDSGDQVAISLAISEVTRNILNHAGSGVVTLRITRHASGGQAGLEVVATNHVSAVTDVKMALLDSYTTGDRPGLGLPAATRLMDEVEVQSCIGDGTTVTMRKWVR